MHRAAAPFNQTIARPSGWRSIDYVEVCTGVAIFAVFFGGTRIAAPVRSYAEHMVAMTFLIEFAMLFVAFAAKAATRLPASRDRLVALVLGVIAYVLVTTFFLYRLRAPLLIVQVLAIPLLRMRSRGDVPVLSAMNLKRLAVLGVTSVVLLFCQFLVIIALTATASGLGLVEPKPDALAPDWILAIAAGGFYIELAIIGPRVVNARL